MCNSRRATRNLEKKSDSSARVVSFSFFFFFLVQACSAIILSSRIIVVGINEDSNSDLNVYNEIKLAGRMNRAKKERVARVK